jgi:SAM-dependent methyltransferase
MNDIYDADYLDGQIGRGFSKIERLVPFFDVSRDHTVLDVGCGPGKLYQLIQNSVQRYEGVDSSPTAIDHCRRMYAQHSNAVFSCNDVVSFCSAKGEQFDRAFMIDFVEHVRDVDLARILDAVRSSMRFGGKLYIHTPNGRFLMEVLKAKGLYPQTLGHIGIRAGEQYREFLGLAGFSVEQLRMLPHQLRLLSWLHLLHRLPLVGELCGARLFIEAQKGEADRRQAR